MHGLSLVATSGDGCVDPLGDLHMVTNMRLLLCFLVSVCYFLPTAEVVAGEIADLVALLQSDKPKVRYDAARSLKKLGAKAEPAIKPLVGVLNDQGAPIEHDLQYFGPRVRDAASEALVQIGRPAVPALIEALNHKDKSVREMAARTLGKLGPLAKDSFAALTETLRDPEDWVRWDAVRAIGRVGAEPKVVVPLLERTFRRRKEDYFVRAEALEALHDADPDGTMVIPLLVEGLKDTDGDIMASAAQTLGKFGAKARSAVPELNKALSTKKRRGDAYFDVGYTAPVRMDVVRALADIGPDAAIVVPLLNRLMMKDDDTKTRIWSAAALVRIVPKKPAAELGLAFLVRTLRDENGFRAESAKALGTIGNEAAIKVLIEALQAQDSSKWGTFRESVALALGEIGPPAKAAVPALRKAMSEKRAWHFGVRREAARALGRIGTAAKLAIPDLKRLIESDDSSLHDLATEAIKQILGQSADGANSKVRNER